ncbi:hypothetical protein [Lacrimispora algidixylanolytica]|nr:hypothetical protein [Lacrimispora algidixylanolytica]
MITPITYIYADLIETSLKTGINYKSINEVPEKIKSEVKELLLKRNIEV